MILKKTKFAYGLMFLLIICALLGLYTCRPSLLDKAYALIPIGMNRDEAIRVLRDDAWYHQSCPRTDSIVDLFFYGSHRYDQANIVIVQSDLQQGTYSVTSIGSFDEPHRWQGAYWNCIDVNRFEK